MAQLKRGNRDVKTLAAVATDTLPTRLINNSEQPALGQPELPTRQAEIMLQRKRENKTGSSENKSNKRDSETV